MSEFRDTSGLNESPSLPLVRVPWWKRVLDILCILGSLPLLVPLTLAIAIAIKIVSRGPVLFGQERIGYLGRGFWCFKFRTMIVGADTAVHQGYFTHLVGSNLPMVKMDVQGDTRLIPFGLLLRTSGLDELPQIINVLRGEMSLVGPRPCLPYEYDTYLPQQLERFNTLPGLTGLWQVSGKNRTTFDEMIQLDIQYARTKSVWSDVEIILRTVPALVIQIQDTRRARKRTAKPCSTDDSHPQRDDRSTAFGKALPGYSLRQAVEPATRR